MARISSHGIQEAGSSLAGQAEGEGGEQGESYSFERKVGWACRPYLGEAGGWGSDKVDAVVGAVLLGGGGRGTSSPA